MLAKRPHRSASASSSRGTAHSRLTKAFETLTQQAHGNTATVTVTELCRLADVSRNALYRYHAPLLKALREHKRRSPKFIQSKARRSAAQRRAENIGLRQDISKLAALVDHYYAAYQETATLLERRDRELAELRGQLQLRPALLPSARR